MCNLLVGFNNTPNNKEFNALIQAQYDTMESQRNGAAGVVITFDKQIHVFREYEDYQAVYSKVSALLPQAKMVSLHTRISTGGTLGKTNVHFFRDGDYIMAHNGMIIGCSAWSKGYLSIPKTPPCRGCEESKKGVCRIHRDDYVYGEGDTYDPKTEKEDGLPCDTLAFLRELPKPFTAAKLREFSVEKKFSGMAVIINTKTLEMWMIVDKKVTLLTNEKDFGVFFSFEPTKEMSKTIWKTLCAVPYVETVEKIKFPFENKTASYGTHKINYWDQPMIDTY